MVQYIVLSLAEKYRSDILIQYMNLLFHTCLRETQKFAVSWPSDVYVTARAVLY